MKQVEVKARPAELADERSLTVAARRAFRAATVRERSVQLFRNGVLVENAQHPRYEENH